MEFENPSVVIGAYLKEIRKAKNLSIEKLSDISGLSSSQISVIERGFNTSSQKYINITLTSLELLSNALGVSIEDILENSGYYELIDNTIIGHEAALNKQLKSVFKQKYIKLSTRHQQAVINYIDKLLVKQNEDSHR